MKTILNSIVSLFLVIAFVANALPCGPGYVSPVFENSNAPENPYSNYAAGRLGIVNPSFRRSLLIAAYRWVSGGSFSPDEQTALVEQWKSDINRDYTQTDEISEVVKAWVEKRKEVMGKEEKPPEIYAERAYGGYDFFPNCTKNAFETATATLSDRISGHSATDPNVVNWVRAQDQVFGNCSSGQQTPDDPPAGAPEWLQKDRAYQKAAASFYSLNYKDARDRFAEIAQDSSSPWSETADYLVARTLIRQASLSKSAERAAPLYEEAENRLQRFISGTGKFSASAERLEGLIKYRLRPKERVVELGKKLAGQSGNDNFKQDLIDYTWLLDKFESETLAAEDKRKEEGARRKEAAESPKAGASDAELQKNVEAAIGKLGVSVSVTVSNGGAILEGEVTKAQMAEVIRAAFEANVKKVDNRLRISESDGGKSQKNEDELEINISNADYSKTWTVHVKADATDDEALAAAERAVGSPLTEDQKKHVREMRQSAYAERFTKSRQPEYEGGYYGEQKLSLSLMPDFLRGDDLSTWLFVYQMKGDEAYLYSLKKFRESGSELWLMTALSQADKTSTDLKRLFDAADQANRTAPGFMTIVYHTARLYLELGKTVEARKIIDAMINAGNDVPISVQNQFRGLRLRTSVTLDEFLTYSLRTPYAFDFGGSIGSIDELIAEQKKYYDPEYNKEGREAFDREVEDRFKDEKVWMDRMMLDSDTINLMNQSFPQSVMIQIEKSPALPDYLRSRFAIAIWTRAYLLEDYPTLIKISPEIIKYEPDFEEPLLAVLNAKTPTAMKNAALFFVIKNPLFSPYIEDGMGKTDNEFGQWESNDWWCSSYMADSDASDATDDDDTGHKPLKPPPFLTAAQKRGAAAERKKLIDLGDAPQILANRVLAWAARSPADPRVQEALFIVHQANGWTKYGCGNNEDLQKQVSDLMNKRYPSSPWTRKLTEEETDK